MDYSSGGRHRQRVLDEHRLTYEAGSDRTSPRFSAVLQGDVFDGDGSGERAPIAETSNPEGLWNERCNS